VISDQSVQTSAPRNKQQQQRKNNTMTFVGLLIILAACALAWWLVNYRFAAVIAPWIRWLMNFVILLVGIGSVAYATGIWDYVRGIRVPHV